MEWAQYDAEHYQLMKQFHVVHEIEQHGRRKRKIAAILCFFLFRQQNNKKRRLWVSPLLQKREQHGFYKAIFPHLHLEDLRFHNYFRMSSQQLEQLINIIGADLQKQYVVRAPITVKERLLVTLRYLASGDSLISMSYQYLISAAAVSQIVKETCTVIWRRLQPKVLPSILREKDWVEIAKVYEEKWDFPNCIGAIDGKHVVIQCPNNAGSSFFNYKGSHSMVLLAICDGNYMFRFIDVGAYGRRSDGGIFQESVMANKFQNNEMNVPASSKVAPIGRLLHYCLIGDEAFPLRTYLLRPYPGRGNDEAKRIFNYRQSRARKTIEDSFGILSSRWRIYCKSIIMSVPGIKKIIKATVVLHNWLRMQDGNDEVPIKYVADGSGGGESCRSSADALQDITHAGSNNRTRAASQIRDEFCDYFSGDGALDWQYNYI